MPRPITTHTPPGNMIDVLGAVIPPGYLPCDGGAVSKSTYQNLLNAIRKAQTATPVGVTSIPTDWENHLSNGYIFDSANKKMGVPFTPSTNITGNLTASFILGKEFSPTGSITMKIYSSVAGAPGALLYTSSALNLASLPDTYYEPPSALTPVTFTGLNLVSGTEYWMVVDAAGGSYSPSYNRFIWYTTDLNFPGTSKYWNSGSSTWVSWTFGNGGFQMLDTTFSISDTSYFTNGTKIYGPNIAVGATISSVSSGIVTVTPTPSGPVSGTVYVLPFGDGDGSTTFNVPNGMGRLVMNENPTGAGGLSTRTFLQTFGTENETIGEAHLPAHSHASHGSGGQSATHYHGGGSNDTSNPFYHRHSGSASNHLHDQWVTINAGGEAWRWDYWGEGMGYGFWTNWNTTGGGNSDGTYAGASWNSNHAHGNVQSNGINQNHTHTATLSNHGSTTPVSHNNIQSSLVVLKAIKF